MQHMALAALAAGRVGIVAARALVAALLPVDTERSKALCDDIP